MMCMQTILPKTKTVTFKAISSAERNGINWNNPKFEEIEQMKDLMDAYRAPCKGDSGSGQIFLAYGRFGAQTSKTLKYVLAAVYHGRNKESGGQICGEYTCNNNKDDYIKSLAISQSISNPKISDWIKQIIEI